MRPEELFSHFRVSRGLDAAQKPYRAEPELFPQAAMAAERLKKAIENGEEIGIVGDYDCDGITSTALLVRACRRRGLDPIVRLPHRIRDGYGLKPKMIEELAAAGVTLVLTVDTGITANDAVALAKKKGIDVIILDHHQPRDPLPEAYAIVHPALAPAYPEPHPCAAGITFEFLHAVEGEIWADRNEDMVLAMFGTVADLVPLLGRNRALTFAGINALRTLPKGPIRDLVESACGEKSVSSVDVAFRIAPRINAAGRMDDPRVALEALLEGGDALQRLEELNAARQSSTISCLRDVLTTIEADDAVLAPFLVSASPDYPAGIVGLLAGKLTDQFGRPSMVAAVQGETATASLRSIDGYSVIDALERHATLFESFGGHAQAAGCTFALKNLPLITEALIADVRAMMGTELLVPSMRIDASLHPSSISVQLCNALSYLAPFGQGNPEPTFMIEHTELTGLKAIGDDAKHLRGNLGPHGLIGFNLGHLISRLEGPVDIACKVGMNEWNGRTNLQLMVMDIRKK